MRALGAGSESQASVGDLMADGLATVVEAARFLGIGKSKVHQLMTGGELAHVKFGSSRRLPWVALKQFAHGHLVEVRPKVPA
jgi:excisionase family DNA binding protein